MKESDLQLWVHLLDRSRLVLRLLELVREVLLLQHVHQLHASRGNCGNGSDEPENVEVVREASHVSQEGSEVIRGPHKLACRWVGGQAVPDIEDVR